jgi:hypothetical protein
MALERLTDNATGGNRPATSKAKLRDPDQIDGVDPKKHWGLLLQCKLNFRAKPESFYDDSTKGNYILSFLKGTALDYFEPFLIDDPANEPRWLTNFQYFTKELYIYCGPYNQQAEAEIELEQLMMKDNHKVTKFLLTFTKFRLCSTTGTRLVIGRLTLPCQKESRMSCSISTSPKPWMTLRPHSEDRPIVKIDL